MRLWPARFLIGLLFVPAFTVAIYELRSPFLRALILDNPVEVLFLGQSDEEDSFRAEMIALARVEPSVPVVKILQIPRDLRMQDGSVKRIGGLYAQGKPKAIRSQIESLVFQGVESEDIPQADLVAQISDLEAMMRSLNETKWALNSTQSDDSYGSPLKATLAGNPESLFLQRELYHQTVALLYEKPWRLIRLARQGAFDFRGARSSLSFLQALAFFWRARLWATAASSVFFELPTVAGPSGAVRVDKTKASSMLAWWQDTPPSLFTDSQPVTIEILNASLVSGTAYRWMRLLRDTGGFDVVYFGNAASDIKQTSVLLIRRASISLAKEVTLSLNKLAGVNCIQEIYPHQKGDLQFTLLLGEDASRHPRAQALNLLDLMRN